MRIPRDICELTLNTASTRGTEHFVFIFDLTTHILWQLCSNEDDAIKTAAQTTFSCRFMSITNNS